MVDRPYIFFDIFSAEFVLCVPTYIGEKPL